MPSEPTVRKDVEGRARERFLSGARTCSIDICGPVAPTEPDVVRWPAKFYTQRELQAAVNDQGSRRRLLYRLIPETSEELTELDAKTGELDGPLWAFADALEERLRSEYIAAEQEFQNVDRARSALDRFRSAGSEQLAQAQKDLGRLTASRSELSNHQESLFMLSQRFRALSIPVFDESAINASLTPERPPSAARLLRRLKAALRLAANSQWPTGPTAGHRGRHRQPHRRDEKD